MVEVKELVVETAFKRPWFLNVWICANKACDTRICHQLAQNKKGRWIIPPAFLRDYTFASMLQFHAESSQNTPPQEFSKQNTLRMKEIEGYSAKEISEALGCSRPSVYQLLEKAKKKAAEYLAE